jgi:hypothetical protein
LHQTKSSLLCLKFYFQAVPFPESVPSKDVAGAPLPTAVVVTAAPKPAAATANLMTKALAGFGAAGVVKKATTPIPTAVNTAAAVSAPVAIAPPQQPQQQQQQLPPPQPYQQQPTTQPIATGNAGGSNGNSKGTPLRGLAE